jgi:hypothetical protein
MELPIDGGRHRILPYYNSSNGKGHFAGGQRGKVCGLRAASIKALCEDAMFGAVGVEIATRRPHYDGMQRILRVHENVHCAVQHSACRIAGRWASSGHQMAATFLDFQTRTSRSSRPDTEWPSRGGLPEYVGIAPTPPSFQMQLYAVVLYCSRISRGTFWLKFFPPPTAESHVE